ncbi:N-acetylglucosamine-6-phosphate deacetylase [Alistipes megaguti]|uniref:N-acetylglucosamine-6-phosphate deacetylase n=1 Tax=Alistipes megaguti TaxID=2364787 RepID=UPI000EFDA775|nr:N-acetylglucosamine-6-phosphate deacetylase [Alistipes megaguti]
MVTAIINGKILTPGKTRFGVLLLEDGKIRGIEDSAPEGARILDAEGDYVSPGFIDMHTHGAGGADFMDGTVDAYLTAARMHAKHGTTLLYPTTLTSTNEALYESFDTYRKAKLENRDGAAFGGMHLEGPYFNPEFAGAQDRRYLRNPRPEEYLEILERCPELARWSFAPELDGAADFAAELKRRGIIASIGHTNATFTQCDAAFQAGATHMTHFYSCMSTITRRNAFRYAGTIEYGYYQDGITLEIIADGIHVPKDLLLLLLKIKGAERISLVTDSMRAAGMPEGKSILGGLADGQEVIVEDGVAKLPDRSAFAGSVATTDRLIRTMVSQAGCSIPDAVRMMTENPARVMGIAASKGSIQPGKDADIVIFDENINVKQTIIEGKIIC